tara:strand:- start:1144 stop:1389 length:246 start_codon:yes stop_codon:yes gene_type:complete
MSQKIIYRVIWGIGAYQDFTSVLDAVLFEKDLEVPKGYPQPYIIKLVDDMPPTDIFPNEVLKEISELLENSNKVKNITDKF